MAPEQLEALETRARGIIEDLLAGREKGADILTTPSGRNPVPHEIGRRIRLNAEVVTPDRLRDQVLIVLADYRDHAWTYGQLKSEGRRVQLADLILKPT